MTNIDTVLESMTFDNFSNGTHKISPEKFFMKRDTVFLDIRFQYEYETVAFNLQHHMPVLNIPINEIPKRWQEIPKDKFVGILCSSSDRAAMVFLYLKGQGFEDVRIIEGGYAKILDEFKPGKLKKIIS